MKGNPTTFDHANLSNIGTNTHAQIDTHVSSTSNPHSVTKAQVGLANVDNTSDANKPVSTATQTALDGKVNTNAAITASTKTKIQYDSKGLVVAGTDAAVADITGLQTALDAKESTANKNQNNGYAGLDSSGKLNPSQLPAIAVTDTSVVASQVDMLALTAEVGDLAVRTDLNKTFILRVSPASTLGNWQELLTPTDSVASVYGRTGIVTAQAGDYTADQITETVSNKILTSAERTKLTGVATGATANSSDSALRDRTTHTGEQAISTVTNLQTTLNLKLEAASIANFETSTQLNSRDTANRNRANHSGSQLASTISDFTSTVLATVLTGLNLATSSVISATDTVLTALGKLQAQVTSLNTNKFDKPVGDTSQYVAGDGSLISFPLFAQADRLVTAVRNQLGSSVVAGTVIYLNGVSGNKPLIGLAQANQEVSSNKTFGLIQATINNNNNGYAVVSGTVSGINTSGFSEGQVLWLSPSVAGGFTSVKPQTPNHAVLIGIVTRSHATQGTVETKIQNGYEIEELHNVLINSPVLNQVIAYDSVDSLWKNLTLSKSSVGLVNVDNTSDANKPVSTAQQTALNAKQNTLVSATNIKTINGASVLGSGDLAIAAAAAAAGSNTQIQFNNSGVFGASSNLTYSGGQLLVTSPATSTVPAVIKGFSGQTANLQQWQNSSGTVLAAVSASGSLGVGATNPDSATQAYITQTTTGSQANALRTKGPGSSVGNWRGRIVAGGDNTAFIMGEYNSQAWLGGHNAVLTAWNDFHIQPDGAANLLIAAGAADSPTGRMGVGISSPQAKVHIKTHSTSVPNLILEGVSSQTANLQEWQNSSGVVLSAISSAGDLISNTTTGTKIGTATNQKLGFFNATPVVQQTGGAATAGALYTATEQGMLQKVYDALRTFGFLS